jgi:hypothetical protein
MIKLFDISETQIINQTEEKNVLPEFYNLPIAMSELLDSDLTITKFELCKICENSYPTIDILSTETLTTTDALTFSVKNGYKLYTNAEDKYRDDTEVCYYQITTTTGIYKSEIFKLHQIVTFLKDFDEKLIQDFDGKIIRI